MDLKTALAQAVQDVRATRYSERERPLTCKAFSNLTFVGISCIKHHYRVRAL